MLTHTITFAVGMTVFVCENCVGEGFVNRPHVLGEVAKGILQLNLGEVEG